MTILSRIFNVDISERKWYKIVLWWELRRIPFNLILILFLYIDYKLLPFLPEGERLVTFNAGPMLVVGALFFFILCFIGANICYTLGWAVQLITRRVMYPLYKIVMPKLFICGVTIAIIVTLSPILLDVVNLIIGKILL